MPDCIVSQQLTDLSTMSGSCHDRFPILLAVQFQRDIVCLSRQRVLASFPFTNLQPMVLEHETGSQKPLFARRRELTTINTAIDCTLPLVTWVQIWYP